MDDLERRHKKAAPLIAKHDPLMNGYEQAHPHPGWALCNCPLAKQIRAVLEIPERTPGSNITIGLDDFGRLVRGQIITKQVGGKQVKLALADVGFDKMLEEVVLASRFK
jgi:hypothetical protein